MQQTSLLQCTLRIYANLLYIQACKGPMHDIENCYSFIYLTIVTCL